MVNLISFYLLRRAGVELNLSNLISIILAILFAYVVNSRFVFRDPAHTWQAHLWAFAKFIGARLVTMGIELGGVLLLVEVLHWGDMVGKVVTQFIVLVLNYVFSRFFVFTTGKKGEKP